MHSALNLLVQFGVKESKGLTAELGSLVEHENKEAHVHEHHVENTATKSLHPDILNSFNVGIQIGKCSHEEQR